MKTKMAQASIELVFMCDIVIALIQVPETSTFVFTLIAI